MMDGRAKAVVGAVAVALLGLALVPTAVDAAISTTAFCANVPTGQSGFTDIAQAGVHQRNVECLKEAGVVTGRTPTTYNPTGTLSRGQMATIVANMIDFADAQDAPGGATVPTLPTPATSQDRFTDDETSVHEGNINRLAQAGVVNGISSTRFNPTGNVSRAQMSSFIAQAVAFIQGVSLPIGPDAFTDDETSVHEPNINRLAEADIADGTGTSGGKAVFSPGREITRAETGSLGNQALAFLHSRAVVDPIPPRVGSGTTTRPELVQATIVGTVTSGVNIGTTVNFRFDEAGAPAGGADETNFRVFNNAGFVDAGDVIAAADSFSVNVRFAAVTSSSAAQALTLATVDPFGFMDFQGELNPEGDAPLGSVASQTLPAGITNAPDIVSIGNFRFGNADNTLVDVTFDEAANDVTAAGAISLHLLYTQGVVDANCSYDSGEGDTVLTYACNDASDDGDLATTIAQSASLVARAVIEPASVNDTTASAHPNPLQIVEVNNSGNTGAPDIATVTFNLNATNGGAAADSALVTFDQNVSLAGAPLSAWTAYGLGGNAELVSPASVVAVGGSGPRQVVLFFANGALTGKVGLSIDDGVVTVSDGSNVGVPNQEDELGVANATTGSTAGNTTRPELVSVARTATLDLGGNPTGGTTYSYAFDEDVDLLNATLFFGYASNGGRFVADACTNDASDSTDHIVRCTGYDANAAGGSQASSSTLRTFAIATVQDGAVSEEGAAANANVAEGASSISG